MDLVDSVLKKDFCSEFLEVYLRDGFGVLSKRETELLILRLLLQHSSRYSLEEPPSAFALARELRVTRSKVRNLLDELAYREGANDSRVRTRLRAVLLKSETTAREGQVSIQIEDGFLREYAKSIVQSEFGKVDTSFDRSIITITGDRFFALAANVLETDEKNAVELALKKYRTVLKDERGSSWTKKFISAVAGGASGEVGALAIGLGSKALTGSLDQLPDILTQIFSKF